MASPSQPNAHSRKKNNSKKQIHPKRKSKKEMEREKVQNEFDDHENKYLFFVIKKIRSLRKKIKQCEKIKNKIDEGVNVNKEELEVLEKKDKIEFAISELEKYLPSIKEIAIDEKVHELEEERKRCKEEKENEQNYKLYTEKIEKELSRNAKNKLKEALSKKDADFDARIKEKGADTENITVSRILELHFAAKFIENINDAELTFLIGEICEYFQKDNKIPPTDYGVTIEDIQSLMLFVNRVFPEKTLLEEVSTFKDELTNSIKILTFLLSESKDPVDGINAKLSYLRTGELAKAITSSSLFYNRYSVNENIAIRPIGNFSPHLLEINNVKIDTNEVQNEKNVDITKKNSNSNEIEKKREISFVVPETVPVSLPCKNDAVERENKRDMEEGKKENNPDPLENKKEVKKSTRKINGEKLNGRNTKIQESKPKNSTRGSGRGRYRGRGQFGKGGRAFRRNRGGIKETAGEAQKFKKPE